MNVYTQKRGLLVQFGFLIFVLTALDSHASERSERLAAEREAEANELGTYPDMPLLTRTEAEIVAAATMPDAKPEAVKILRERSGLTERLLESMWDNFQNPRTDGTRLLFKALAERTDLKAEDVGRIGDEVEKMILLPRVERPSAWTLIAPEGLLLLAKNQEPRTERLCIYLLENDEGVKFIPKVLEAIGLVGGQESAQAIQSYMDRIRSKTGVAGRIPGQALFDSSLNAVSLRTTGQGLTPSSLGESITGQATSGAYHNEARSGIYWIGLVTAFLASGFVGWQLFAPKSRRKS